MKAASTRKKAEPHETRLLYEFARDLAGAASIERVAATTEVFLLEAVRMRALVLLPKAEAAPKVANE